MNNSFSVSLDTYLDVWKNSSLVDLRELISQDYKAREITGNDIVDLVMKRIKGAGLFKK